MTKKHVKPAGILLAAIIFSMSVSTIQAAPHWGDKTQLKQPDGSVIEALIFGDEFVRWFESPDGYTITKDPATGWYCYAVLSKDENLTSSSIKYRGKAAVNGSAAAQLLNDAKIQKKVRPGSKKIKEMRNKKMMELNTDSKGNKIRSAAGNYPAMSALNSPDDNIHDVRTGAQVGITIAIDFSDDTATVPLSAIDSMLNLANGYSTFGNNGSVREYFSDASGGQLDYTNNLYPVYYRAAHPKTYYEDTTIPYGTRARELVTEALNFVETNGYDFSTLSHDSGNTIYAINCFYAGFATGGLWPHSWSLAPVFTADSVHSGSYQVTNIGNSLSIGTFCHENGHMLLDYPDLYDYDYDSRGVGQYCLMAYQDDKNPVPPNPYLRDYSGWQTIIDATFMTNDTLLFQPSNSLSAYRYMNTNETPAEEYFLIEAVRPDGDRYQTLQDSGLLIWHIDRTNSSNDFNEMTCDSHFIVSVEQADNLFHLENDLNGQDANDLFDAAGNDEFSDATSPDAFWWCNTVDGDMNSHLRVYDISAPGNVMSFRISGANNFAVTHPSTIPASAISQNVTVTTGHANQVVNLNGTGIDEMVVTTGTGIANFSVIANTIGDTIWVTVTGSGLRYRGFIIVTASIPPHDTVSDVMGFEDASLWQFIFGTTGTLRDTNVVTEGTTSLDVRGNRWQQFKSINLNTADIHETSSALKFDIFVGTVQPNRWWIGQVQMYINCPSAGLYNVFVGSKELTGLPLGSFSTVTINLPANVMSALAGTHNDFSFSFALNTNQGSGPYIFDNMRF